MLSIEFSLSNFHFHLMSFVWIDSSSSVSKSFSDRRHVFWKVFVLIFVDYLLLVIVFLIRLLLFIVVNILSFLELNFLLWLKIFMSNEFCFFPTWQLLSLNLLYWLLRHELLSRQNWIFLHYSECWIIVEVICEHNEVVDLWNESFQSVMLCEKR